MKRAKDGPRGPDGPAALRVSSGIATAHAPGLGAVLDASQRSRPRALQRRDRLACALLSAVPGSVYNKDARGHGFF